MSISVKLARIRFCRRSPHADSSGRTPSWKSSVKPSPLVRESAVRFSSTMNCNSACCVKRHDPTKAVAATVSRPHLVQRLARQPGAADGDGGGEGAHLDGGIHPVHAHKLGAGGERAQLQNVGRGHGLLGQPHARRGQEARLQGAVPLLHQVGSLEQSLP